MNKNNNLTEQDFLIFKKWISLATNIYSNYLYLNNYSLEDPQYKNKFEFSMRIISVLRKKEQETIEKLNLSINQIDQLIEHTNSIIEHEDRILNKTKIPKNQLMAVKRILRTLINKKNIDEEKLRQEYRSPFFFSFSKEDNQIFEDAYVMQKRQLHEENKEVIQNIDEIQLLILEDYINSETDEETKEELITYKNDLIFSNSKIEEQLLANQFQIDGAFKINESFFGNKKGIKERDDFICEILNQPMYDLMELDYCCFCKKKTSKMIIDECLIRAALLHLTINKYEQEKVNICQYIQLQNDFLTPSRKQKLKECFEKIETDKITYLTIKEPYQKKYNKNNDK